PLLSSRPEALQVLPRDHDPRVYVWDYAMRPPAGHGHPRDGLLNLLVQPSPRWPRDEGVALGFQAYLYPPTPARWGVRGSYDPDLLGLMPLATRDAALLVRAVEDTPAFARMMQVGSVDAVLSLHDERLDGLLPT